MKQPMMWEVVWKEYHD